MKDGADTHGSLARALPTLKDPVPDGEPPPWTHDFETLYAAHAAFTWRTLRHLGISFMAIEDAVQELWVVVHRRHTEFEGRSDVKTWLFGIAVNVARNHRRTARRRPEGVPLPLALAAADSDPHRREERAEAFSLVQGFLETLDDQRRQVFVCALLEGWSALETAAATGLDEGSVQNRVRALRRSFKAWIEKKRSEG
jgi:RNA polymerase sigma-70 factor (ECF subfamily)